MKSKILIAGLLAEMFLLSSRTVAEEKVVNKGCVNLDQVAPAIYGV